MRRNRILLLTMLASLGAAVHAHPHMWIDGTFELQLDNNGLSGIRATWEFDEFNGSEMIFMFDDDFDGRLSAAEVRRVHDEAFVHLVQLDYFMVAFSGERQLTIPEADSFDARIDRGRLVYEFTVPLRVPWQNLDDLVIAFFDESFFIDFVSVADADRYNHAGHTLRLQSETLRLASQGWGNIYVPAVRTVLR
jgi:nickel/cobalt transporter (NicO) family protein